MLDTLQDTLIRILYSLGTELYTTKKRKLDSLFQETVLAVSRSAIFSGHYMLFFMLSAGLTSCSWEEE